jgi:hypothetical protein
MEGFSVKQSEFYIIDDDDDDGLVIGHDTKDYKELDEEDFI